MYYKMAVAKKERVLEMSLMVVSLDTVLKRADVYAPSYEYDPILGPLDQSNKAYVALCNADAYIGPYLSIVLVEERGMYVPYIRNNLRLGG